MWSSVVWEDSHWWCYLDMSHRKGEMCKISLFHSLLGQKSRFSYTLKRIHWNLPCKKYPLCKNDTITLCFLHPSPPRDVKTWGRTWRESIGVSLRQIKWWAERAFSPLCCSYQATWGGVKMVEIRCSVLWMKLRGGKEKNNNKHTKQNERSRERETSGNAHILGGKKLRNYSNKFYYEIVRKESQSRYKKRKEMYAFKPDKKGPTVWVFGVQHGGFLSFIYQSINLWIFQITCK